MNILYFNVIINPKVGKIFDPQAALDSKI